MKYRVKLLYYSSREVVVDATNEEEAKLKAQTMGIDEFGIIDIGSNAVLEGVDSVEKCTINKLKK